MAPSEAFDITRTKHIEAKCESYALAETQRKKGKADLYDFIIFKRSTEKSKSITTTLELQNAPSDLHYLLKLQLRILQERLKGCNNERYQSAKEILGKNEITLKHFPAP